MTALFKALKEMAEMVPQDTLPNLWPTISYSGSIHGSMVPKEVSTQLSFLDVVTFINF